MVTRGMKGYFGAGGRLVALLAGIATSPIVAVAIFAVWMQDRRTPFYLPVRIGLGGRPFRLFKLRSMVINADRTKVDTTIDGDTRVTPVGNFIRRLKLDELPQFWNVVLGTMALVGPRPNISRETDLYTTEELRILSVKPGITDISSIVFSDLGTILTGADDPNLAYNQLIRPWKSRLALFYIDHKSLALDWYIVAVTAISIINHKLALNCVAELLRHYNAPESLVEIAMRSVPLVPSAPPGANDIVVDRNA